MKQKKKRLLAWLLTLAVVFSSQSVLVMAETFSDVEEADGSQTAEIAEAQSAEDVTMEETLTEPEQQETQSIAEEQILESEAEELLPEEPEETAQTEDMEEGFSAGEAESGEISDHMSDSQYVRNDVLLTGWTYHVDRTAYRYVPTKAHPEGEGMEMEVTEFTVTNEDPKDTVPVCTIVKKDDTGWEVRADHLGNAVLTLKYGNSPVKNDVEKIRLFVKKDHYELEISYPDGNDNMFQNSKKTANVVLKHNWYYSNKNQGTEEVKNWTLEFDQNSEGWSYDKALVTVKISGHKAVITSKEKTGTTGILFRGRMKDKNGKTTVLEGNITWINVKECKHNWKYGKITKAATVFKTGTKTRTCSRCKKQENVTIPKLKAKLTLSASTLPLQKGKSAVVKISGLQKGDSVKTITVPSKYKSALKAEKTKSGDLKLTAKKASGTVKVTVTTAAKASKTVTVKLQSSSVKTKKITGISSKLTVKKGKTASLKPVRNPISSQEKFTYQSSNKKIATVDSKGTIKGIRPGKTVITVKSGTIKVKCTVTVTK